MMASQRLRTLINRSAIAVAALIAIAIPAGNFYIDYHSKAETLAFKSRLGASRVAQYIYTHNSFWQYQTLRLGEVIQLPETGEAPIAQTIFDRDGKIVVQQGPVLRPPVVERRSPIIVSGQTAGTLSVATSLWTVIITSLYVDLFSVALAAAVYLILRSLPLRALDRAISELRASERALAVQNERLDAALTNMVQGLCMYDAEGRLLLFNARFAEIYGLPSDKIVAGMTTRELMAAAAKHGKVMDANPEETLALRDAIARDQKGGTFVQRLTDGRSISIAYRPRPGGGFVVTFEDITARLAAEERIRHLARFDPLTDLPNRATFYEQSTSILAHLRRGEQVAFLSLDLDHFKSVNDTLGHPIGDLMLKAVAERMKSCIRGEDFVARLGGDEFALVQVPSAQAPDLPALASRLIEAVGAPYEIEGHQIVIGLSIGIALAPADGSEPDLLMKNADLALYRAKADGGGTYRFFEAAMDARMQARRALELDLRRAVLKGEFELEYQPIINVKTGAITSCEALVRWRHPQRGLIPPGDFIAVAEATGLIVPIGDWVLTRACTEAARWPEHIMISVNLSPAQFRSRNIVQTVRDALAKSGLRANRLELEITELVLLEETEGAFAILHQLRDLGIKIAMDDFGTGYSSLGYLRSFPFDKIKIDQSFIRDLPHKEDSVAIVRAVVGLGSSLGITTTAEGVETKDQLASLTSEGCNEFQGFLYSRPVPAAEIAKLFALERAGEAKLG
ncbi:MAG: EAL domain-containing protein [Pseudolabrys sp.]|nr:EAL domain-containing protein [Pseudolabrys sp.]